MLNPPRRTRRLDGSHTGLPFSVELDAFGVTQTLVQVLTQCGNDLSRENIVKQATSLSKLQLGVIADGITITTGPTDFRPYEQLQLARFDGNKFVAFGQILAVN